MAEFGGAISRHSGAGVGAEQAEYLYQVLIAPAKEEIAGAPIIGIIPDGTLWELPFAALKASHNRYLLQDHALFYAPSLTGLKAMMGDQGERSPRERRSVLAMAPFGIAELRRAAPAGTSSANPESRGSQETLPQSGNEVTATCAMFREVPASLHDSA